jgi:hypothetical protein
LVNFQPYERSTEQQARQNNNWIGSGPGYEINLLYIAGLIALILGGGGSFVDRCIAKSPRVRVQDDAANLILTPATAMPPSPTAAAQRFSDPERTSPAAKIPGKLVSRGPG